jgi:hypothetical protein
MEDAREGTGGTMRRMLVAVLMPCVMSGVAGGGVEAAELTVGALVGASVLETKDTSLSHASLQDEVTLGRTILGGVVLGLRLEGRHEVALEIAGGPYSNDVERSCIWIQGPLCQLMPFKAASRAVLYGLHYTFMLQPHRKSAFVGLGMGAKKYSYDDTLFVPGDDRASSVAVHGAVGAEFPGKADFRLETRVILVTFNPFLSSGRKASQVELQIRASIRFHVGK